MSTLTVNAEISGLDDLVPYQKRLKIDRIRVQIRIVMNPDTHIDCKTIEDAQKFVEYYLKKEPRRRAQQKAWATRRLHFAEKKAAS